MSNPFDDASLGGLFGEMRRLQQQLENANAIAEHERIEGSAGGGAVRAAASGEFNFSRITIDPAVVAAGDVEILEDLVLAAVQDAVRQLIASRRDAISRAVGGALGGILSPEVDIDQDIDEPGAPDEIE